MSGVGVKKRCDLPRSVFAVLSDSKGTKAFLVLGRSQRERCNDVDAPLRGFLQGHLTSITRQLGETRVDGTVPSLDTPKVPAAIVRPLIGQYHGSSSRYVGQRCVPASVVCRAGIREWKWNKVPPRAASADEGADAYLITETVD